MKIKLPSIIEEYVSASNRHDVKSVVVCFSDNATVYDEREEHRGKQSIEAWIGKTIEKYKFQFKPVSVMDADGEIVVAIEVSGSFDGSPITVDYHFTLENEIISSLTIE